jgi:hypothetical protein
MQKLQVTNRVRKHLRNFTLFVLALALLSGFAALADSGNKVNGSSPVGGKVLKPQQPEANAQGRPNAQVFAGEGVRLRALQLRSSNLAIARAMKGFEKRGQTPKWDQSLTILETGSKSRAMIEGRAIKPVSYPQTFSDGTYELTLITYSNSSSQWEGILYFHNPYEDDTYAALITTPATSQWDTEYEYWFPPDGGDPTCGGGSCEVQGRLSQRPKAGFVSTSHNSLAGRMVRGGFWGRIKQWVGCVWTQARLGAYWCSDLWCALGVLGSAILHC